VRAFVIMVLGLAGFTYFVVHPHRVAQDLLRSEQAALTEMKSRAAAADRNAATVGGYDFYWERERVLIARPVAAGKTGYRWFATTKGAPIYEFDTSVFKSGLSGPPTRSMVEYLSMKESQRTTSTRPPGWKPLN
jgi:hypothetical protein